MIALFDLDSLVYDSLYKIISFGEAKYLIKEIGLKKTKVETIERAYNRMNQMIEKILTSVEDSTKSIDETKLYITYNLSPIRNKIYPFYKSKRKKNKWATKLRNKIIQDDSFEVFYDFEYEADDLIYDEAKRLREKGVDYICISKDKDILKGIEGASFDYYKQDTGETDDYFNPIKEYRGVGFNTKEDVDYFLATQLLIGDSVDNIPNVVYSGKKQGLGKIKAEKILNGKSGFALLRTVYLEYQKTERPKDIRRNYYLCKLGKTHFKNNKIKL